MAFMQHAIVSGVTRVISVSMEQLEARVLSGEEQMRSAIHDSANAIGVLRGLHDDLARRFATSEERARLVINDNANEFGGLRKRHDDLA